MEREEACHRRSCLPDTSPCRHFRCLAKRQRGALCRAHSTRETRCSSLLFHHLATTIISASIVPPRRLPAPWSRCLSTSYLISLRFSKAPTDLLPTNATSPRTVACSRRTGITTSSTPTDHIFRML